MNHAGSSNKVISITRNLSDKKDSDSLRQKKKTNTRVIAITSGKGGVGKTNIVANLGFALSRLRKKVLVLDADLGLGNLDVLLGIAPKYNLSHVVAGEKSISDIIVKGPGEMKILPAGSGIQEITDLSRDQKIRILSELDTLLDTVDILLIDTAAGISSNVMYFNVSAQNIIVVATPEPTSMTDAYALMKVLSMRYSEKKFSLLVNLAASVEEAHEVFRQLDLVAKRFLDISIEYIGYVLADKNVTKGVRHQKIVSELYPDTIASRCFATLAEKVCKLPPPKFPKGDAKIFWKSLVQNKFA
ncbi:MAG: MinD/ParA family protein [Deltaproteobacteria bacterium]|nr:MinD/ParA family protein [Deltaproteobacteria bacterium]